MIIADSDTLVNDERRTTLAHIPRSILASGTFQDGLSRDIPRRFVVNILHGHTTSPAGIEVTSGRYAVVVRFQVADQLAVGIGKAKGALGNGNGFGRHEFSATLGTLQTLDVR